MIKFSKTDSNQSIDVKNFFNKYNYLLWSLGIGDFLTLDSFIPDFFYKKIKKIFLFTSRNETFKNLITANKNYSNIQVIFADDKYDKGEIYKIDNYIEFFCLDNKIDINECFQDDLLIWRTPLIRGIKPKVSSFFTKKLCDVNCEFSIEKLCIICPTTTNTRDRRFFTNDDWEETIKILKYNKLQGIVIGDNKSEIPKTKEIIDLTGKTTIIEAIEITKKSKYYIGIDTFLSTLAMQLLPEENIYIKSTESHLLENIKFFSPFKNNISFIYSKINEENFKF
jgi:hypothetical protein